MASFSVLGTLDVDQILRAVPPDLRSFVRIATRGGERYHVLLFAHNRDHGSVNTSGVVRRVLRRVLRRVPAGVPLLAIGSDFTQEATDLLDAHEVTIARVGILGWTDASYFHLHDRD